MTFFSEIGALMEVVIIDKVLNLIDIDVTAEELRESLNTRRDELSDKHSDLLGDYNADDFDVSYLCSFIGDE